jgi:hypothetical protein
VIRKFLPASVLVAVALLVLGACGDDDAAAPDEEATTTSTAEGTETTDGAAAPPTTTGDVTQTIEAPPQETLPPTPLDQPVDVEGARIELSDVERVEAEARLPGEVAGPAVAIHVRITNTGSTAIDLSAVTVNAHDASGQASAPLTTPPAAPLAGELAPGEDAEGVYLFEFGEGRTEPITIEVSHAVQAPVAVFVGPIS